MIMQGMNSLPIVWSSLRDLGAVATTNVKEVKISVAIHSATMHSGFMLTRELVAASTEPMILSLLAGGESYGYALIQRVRELSGERVEWTDGMLYPVLHRLEERGLIKSRWGVSETGRKRKYYAIKKEGKKAMSEHLEQWNLISGMLAGLEKGGTHV
jgi:PadR family transcriptional regulator PadR